MSSVLAQIAAGKSGALEECMDQYGGLVWTLARRWSASDADAEDAVQEVFLTLWKNAARFDETKSSEKTFIAMVTRRRLIDRIRHSKRRPELEAFPEDGREPVDSHHEQIERSVEAAQAARYLDSLTPVQRQIIQLSIYQGMSHSEIAKAVEMPVGTVKSHLFRGLAAVRKTVAEAQGGTA